MAADDPPVQPPPQAKKLKPGGVITVSPVITPAADASFLQKIKFFVQSLWQTWWRHHKVDTVMESMKVEVGYTMSSLSQGRYLEGPGKLHKEKALEIKIKDVDSGFLVEVAQKLKKEFQQQVVMLEDHNTGQTEIL